MVKEPLCGGFVHPFSLLRTITLTLVSSATFVYRGLAKSGAFYAGRVPSKWLVEAGGEARPNDCQGPVNHIDKKSEEPKI